MVYIKLCKPYRSPLQAVFILVFTAVFVVISVTTARIFPKLDLLFRIVGGIFLLIGFVLLFRFTMTEFVYVLSDNVLIVRRTIGLTESVVFSLELTDKTELFAKSEFKKKHLRGGSYRQNLTASSAFVVYEKSGKKRYAEIEPNIEFYSLLKSAIEDIKDK